MSTMLVQWYFNGWIYIGLFIALLCFGWVYYDTQQRLHPSATTWRILTLVGAFLILPSLYLLLTTSPLDMAGALAGFALGAPTTGALGNFTLFGYLGLAGVLLAVGAAAYYAFAVRDREIDAGGGGTITETYHHREEKVSSMESTDVGKPTVEPSNPARLDPTRLVTDSTPAMGWLAVKKGSQPGRQFKLGNGRNGIGRDGATCAVVLDDDATSKQHAQVNFENGQFYLYDMASTNGTFVNGQRWQKRQMLYDNDEVRVGDTVLIFKRVKGAR